MEPLANKMRPKKLDDIIGQEHLVGKDKIITNLINNKKLFSLIFYGEPGTGKTSLANAIVNELNLNYRELNAVINNKNDFDIAIEEAKMYGKLIVVIDEIHRMNKDKQDLLLPHIESGIVTIIGLTTSNPFHSINPAIRSRCQIFKLNPLTDENIKEGIKRGAGYLDKIKIDDDSINFIVSLSGGDLRLLLTFLKCLITVLVMEL